MLGDAALGYRVVVAGLLVDEFCTFGESWCCRRGTVS